MKEWEMILNVLLAIVLGFAIGFERKLRLKEAGIRTHAIVCLGSCLMMLVSKYGFDGIDADGARVAAQIVSGIGFIGAGMILYKRQVLHGLTTAAGIWTTAGIGMCVGAGLYYLSLGATVLIILVQCVMHLNISIFKQKTSKLMRISFICNGDEYEIIKKLFNVEKFAKINANRAGDDIIFTVMINTVELFSDKYIKEVLKNNAFITSIERVEDEL